MVLFPEVYSKPVLVDIIRAADLGWNADCAHGDSASTGFPACTGGSGAGPGNKSVNALVIYNTSESRLINTDDVGHGL
jgi:hypothetical protein